MRSEELMRRAGIDPVSRDPRPLAEIMDDYIPYGRFAMETYLLRRKGYASWVEWLRVQKKRPRKIY
jgi:hypothetical protein